MIHEIINFTKNLEEFSPEVFNVNKEPSKGIHLWVRLDEQGKVIKDNIKQGENFDFYDGKGISPLLKKAIRYEAYGQRVGTTMNKVLDKKKKIVSCSPFIEAFRKKFTKDDTLEGDGFGKIINLLPYYFKNAQSVCLNENDETNKQWSQALQQNSLEIFSIINDLKSDTGESLFTEMKDDYYVNIYLDNVAEDDYSLAHKNYLKSKLFNTDKYNQEVDGKTYGLSNYLNGLNSKKPFLEHKTSALHKGISGRLSDSDVLWLNNFEILLGQKCLPNPLPIFVDKAEFKNTEQLISLFLKDEKLSFSHLLKALFDKESNLNLQNYYLLFMERGELKDFDFVSSFRYEMKGCEVKNVFGLKQKDELKPTIIIKDIFAFERIIVRIIFNNSLVKVKEDSYRVNYFGEIDPQYVGGGELMAQVLMKYRRAFYDYIYKSRKAAITSGMFDEIMWNGILADFREDKFKDNRHTKTYAIKEKLNVWFSLYNYFDLQTTNRTNMANRTVELSDRLKEIGREDSTEHISTDDEFAFAAGQLIRYLLNKNQSSNRSHALFIPFLQKIKVGDLREAILREYKKYAHAITLYNGAYAFDKIYGEVLTHELESKSLKPLLPLMTAGFVSESVFKKQNKEVELEEA